MKIILKELSESRVSLKIVVRGNLMTTEQLNKTLNECEELISIFYKSHRNRNKY